VTREYFGKSPLQEQEQDGNWLWRWDLKTTRLEVLEDGHLEEQEEDGNRMWVSEVNRTSLYLLEDDHLEEQEEDGNRMWGFEVNRTSLDVLEDDHLEEQEEDGSRMWGFEVNRTSLDLLEDDHLEKQEQDVNRLRGWEVNRKSLDLLEYGHLEEKQQDGKILLTEMDCDDWDEWKWLRIVSSDNLCHARYWTFMFSPITVWSWMVKGGDACDRWAKSVLNRSSQPFAYLGSYSRFLIDSRIDAFYLLLAEIPGVARDWRQSERNRVII
jgi:hypothetical protein